MTDLEKETQRLGAQFRAEIDGKLAGMQEHITEVQAQVNSSPGSIRASGHAMQGAIPDSHRYLIERRERAMPEIREKAGRVMIPDPYTGAAMDLWLSLSFAREFNKLPGARATTTLDPMQVLPGLISALGGEPVQKAGAWLEGVAAAGGNLVPTLVEKLVNRMILDASLIRPHATVITMDNNSINLPTETAGFVSYISAEGISITAGNSSFGVCNLRARRYNGLATVSNELIADSAPGIMEYTFSIIAEGIGRMQDDQAIQGDGTNVTGLSIVSGIGSGTNNGTNGTGGGVPYYADLVRAMYAAQNLSTRAGASWIMNPGVAMNVMASVTTDGSPIFLNNVSGAPPSTLLGLPLVVSSAVSTRETQYTSSSPIYVGPLGKIVYGDRTGVDISIDPYSFFSSFVSQIRVLQRCGIAIPVGSYFYKMRGNKYL